jgi:hypothetical protein
MVTRAKAGIRCPNPKYALTSTATTALPPLPSSAHAALRDAAWTDAMRTEYDALLRNKTWSLVDRPPGARVISSKWVFKYKLCADGTLELTESALGCPW